MEAGESSLGRQSSNGAAAAEAREPVRILVASHSDPRLTKGGAEIAAHYLFRALNESPDYEAWFLGCARDPLVQRPGITLSQPFSDREYLYATGSFDWFKFSNGDWNFAREFRLLIQELRPQIVHFHHYINFGVEALLHVRECLPDCKIFLTLHEYLAICHHHGQMVTRPNRTLCYESSPMRCASCFSDLSPTDFFLRRLYIQRFFDLVDRFIAPSKFLADRYVAWGIAADRIAVIENAIAEPISPAALANSLRRDDVIRIGFFGQISPLKGIHVLLDAAKLLEERGVQNVLLEIHGDYSGQPGEFQAEFRNRLANLGRNVLYLGPYDQSRVDHLMRSVDAILIPSIWWENSPLVIQEARRNGRPVICSDIGGMAEKVQDGVGGLHFPVGSSSALASLLTTLAATPSALRSMQQQPPRSMNTAATVAGIMRLYGGGALAGHSGR